MTKNGENNSGHETFKATCGYKTIVKGKCWDYGEEEWRTYKRNKLHDLAWKKKCMKQTNKNASDSECMKQTNKNTSDSDDKNKIGDHTSGAWTERQHKIWDWNSTKLGFIDRLLAATSKMCRECTNHTTVMCTQGTVQQQIWLGLSLEIVISL